MYGDASDILESNSSIVDELLNDANTDPRNHFRIKKHSISNNTGLKNGKLIVCIYTSMTSYIMQ